MLWNSVKAIVLLCLVLGVYLWFRRAQQELKLRWDAVTAAAQQRQSVRDNPQDYAPEAFSAVLERSEHIYAQAAEMYDQTLAKPLFRLPAAVLGFQPLTETDGIG